MPAVYYCGICGKKYDNIEDRIACETKCLKEKNNKAAEDAKVAKKAEAQKAIDQKIADWLKMHLDITEMIGDYYEEFEPDVYSKVYSESEKLKKEVHECCNEGCKCKEGEENTLISATETLEDFMAEIFDILLED